MKYGRKDSINFYRGYQQWLASQKNHESKRKARLVAPLALLLAVLLGVAGILLAQNREKRRQLETINAHMESLRPDYQEALDVQSRLSVANATYQALAAGQFTFQVYPTLNAGLFDQVRECAKDIFNISAYSYDETTRTLSVDASAESVNEVPKFVERLRATGLFESVHYTGYTSDDSQEYYCTVGCTLAYFSGAQAAGEEGIGTLELETELDDAPGDVPG